MDYDGTGVRPRISVVIAAYNAERTLGEQLAALADQHEVPDVAWEVLVCDNRSVDRTAEVARSFADRVPGLQVLDAFERQGPAYARNLGAMAARGEFLAFCDADDVVAPDWVAQLNRAFSTHDFLAGRFESERLNSPDILRTRQLSQSDGLQRTRASEPPHAGAGNLGIRRSLFLELGGFDENVLSLEDTDFSWRAQRAGVRLVFIPEVVVHVRLRSTWHGMFTQGRGYGSAQHALELRYPTAAEPAAGGSAGRVSAVLGLFRCSSLGQLVWRLGWISGHRLPQSWARVSIPVPQPLVPTDAGRPDTESWHSG